MTLAKRNRRIERLSAVEKSLLAFTTQPLKEGALDFWKALGYESSRTTEVKYTDLLENAPLEERGTLRSKLEALGPQVSEFHLLFQLTTEDVRTGGQTALIGGKYQGSNIESYIFLAVRLKAGQQPKRSDLADAARTLNQAFQQPVLILFVTGQGPATRISLTAVQRRVNKRDAEKDVLGKVTLVYDVPTTAPRRSLEILTDLHLDELLISRDIRHFVELEQAWIAKFAVEELNKRFYQELSNWFYWASDHSSVSFPDERASKLTEQQRTERRHAHLIRLITRLMFVWFLREKELVPDRLFQASKLGALLKDFDPQGQGSEYYQGILQNLFFASLNTEMGSGRKFLTETKGGYNAEHGVHTVYRYPELFKDAVQALKAFETVPFLNGGLFECLDQTKDKEAGTEERHIDGFSSKADKRAHIPNEVFFLSEPRPLPELNAIYGTKNKKYEVRGLIELLSAYKFTTTENTPIEEEVALDPELLGKVFENLLAAVTEDTQDTARKKTGSFYTPRYVVDDMTDDALLTYFGRVMGEDKAMQARLSDLLAYTSELPTFSAEERRRLVKAVDELDILDPACGSGAFPMGVLQKLVHVLGRLDPENKLWLEQQREREIGDEIKRLRNDEQTATQISEEAIRALALEGLHSRIGEIEKAFDAQYAHHDYARKLFLIENCIYGVDIQPIAVQISKLRCFVSLVVDQHTNEDKADNRGILPLPNLESQFVAANTLRKLGLPSFAENDPVIVGLRAELKAVRHQHFLARTHRQKMNLRGQDRDIRAKLSHEIQSILKAKNDDAELLASFDPYNQNASAQFFDADWMFDQGKFDVVIGNPPYVRQERIKDDKPWLKQNYANYFDGKADLFVYFFARGMELLKPGGVLTYICSNKFFRSGYGKNLRTQLAKKTITRIIDFGDAPVFEAIAYPSIIAVQEAKPADNYTIDALNWNPDWQIDDYRQVMQEKGFEVNQSNLKLDGWQVESPERLKIFEELKGIGQPLEKYINGRFYYGIKTGFNEAFVIPEWKRDELIKKQESSDVLFKPFLRGRDVKRWRVDFAGYYLIKLESSENKTHPWSRKAIEEAETMFAKTYPYVYEWLLEHKDRLIDRSDKGKYWWELRSCAYYKEFEMPKILLTIFMDKPNYSYDDSGLYNNNALHMISTDKKYCLAILNSKVGWWYLNQITTPLQNGFIQAYAEKIGEIPVVTPPEHTERLITQFTDSLLLLASQPSTPQLALSIAFFERVLDTLIYELYLPEELHSRGYKPYKVISAAAWPALSGNAAKDLKALEEVFSAWYAPEHPIRQLTYYIDTVPAVQIIEGKTEAASGAGA